jgi:hypothetical protein
VYLNAPMLMGGVFLFYCTPWANSDDPNLKARVSRYNNT